jgi:hypothetical protein
MFGQQHGSLSLSFSECHACWTKLFGRDGVQRPLCYSVRRKRSQNALHAQRCYEGARLREVTLPLPGVRVSLVVAGQPDAAAVVGDCERVAVVLPVLVGALVGHLAAGRPLPAGTLVHPCQQLILFINHMLRQVFCFVSQAALPFNGALALTGAPARCHENNVVPLM